MNRGQGWIAAFFPGLDGFQGFGPMFKVDEFWQMVEEAKLASSKGQFAFQDEWQAAVSQLKDTDLVDLAIIAREEILKCATPMGFEAFLLSHSSQDQYGFARYCEWIVSHGANVARAFALNPDSLAEVEHPRCRWHDTNLYQSILMFIGIRARFRPSVTIAHFQGSELKEPNLALARACASQIIDGAEEEVFELSSIPAIDDYTEMKLGVSRQDAIGHLPMLAAVVLASDVRRPLIDRRSPMNIEKFWQVMAICRELGGKATDLRSLLGLLPSAQVAQFHELLRACLSNAVSSPALLKSIPMDNPECWLFGIALEGSYAYRAAVATGEVPERMMVPDSAILSVASEIFKSQTFMELPALVTPSKAA